MAPGHVSPDMRYHCIIMNCNVSYYDITCYVYHVCYTIIVYLGAETAEDAEVPRPEAVSTVTFTGAGRSGANTNNSDDNNNDDDRNNDNSYDDTTTTTTNNNNTNNTNNNNNNDNTNSNNGNNNEHNDDYNHHHTISNDHTHNTYNHNNTTTNDNTNKLVITLLSHKQHNNDTNNDNTNINNDIIVTMILIIRITLIVIIITIMMIVMIIMIIMILIIMCSMERSKSGRDSSRAPERRPKKQQAVQATSNRNGGLCDENLSVQNCPILIKYSKTFWDCP